MHLQENAIFVPRNVAQYPLHHVIYAPSKFEVATWRCIYKKIQYLPRTPLHDRTYAATKFEVTTSNGIEGDTFTRNVTDVGPTLVQNWYMVKEKSGYNKYSHTFCFNKQCRSVDPEWMVYLSSTAVVISNSKINSKAGLLYSKFIQLDKVLIIYLLTL